MRVWDVRKELRAGMRVAEGGVGGWRGGERVRLWVRVRLKMRFRGCGG